VAAYDPMQLDTTEEASSSDDTQAEVGVNGRGG
jgi:hypothetical protein